MWSATTETPSARRYASMVNSASSPVNSDSSKRMPCRSSSSRRNSFWALSVNLMLEEKTSVRSTVLPHMDFGAERLTPSTLPSTTSVPARSAMPTMRSRASGPSRSSASRKKT